MDKGLVLVTERTTVYRVFRFNFDNEFAYIEKRANARVQDCYFAEKDQLFMDGSLKPNGIKYFHCSDPFEIKKTNKPINCLGFDDWDNLYYIGDSGEIFNKNGSVVEDE